MPMEFYGFGPSPGQNDVISFSFTIAIDDSIHCRIHSISTEVAGIIIASVVDSVAIAI